METKNSLNIDSFSKFVTIILSYAKHIPFVALFIVYPIIWGFGVFGNYTLIKSVYSNYFSVLLGACFGLFVAFLGEYYYDLPKKLFGDDIKYRYLYYTFAVIYYSLQYILVLTPIILKRIN